MLCGHRFRANVAGKHAGTYDSPEEAALAVAMHRAGGVAAAQVAAVVAAQRRREAGPNAAAGGGGGESDSGGGGDGAPLIHSGDSPAAAVAQLLEKGL